MMNHIIGKLITSDFGAKVPGKYGALGKAEYSKVGKISVERVSKEKFTLEADTLMKCQGHPNVVVCHAIDQDHINL